MIGKRISLSTGRRFIGDLLHAASKVPSVPVQRRVGLAAIKQAREAHPLRPSWTAIFSKAFARVALDMPELRRAYCKLPWPHLYEYPRSVVSIAVEREFQGEKIVLIGRIKDPARVSLNDLSQAIRYLQKVPIDEQRDFQRALRLSRLPRPIRRFAWWIGLNIGRQRGKYFGTFAVSVYSSLGGESLHPLSPCTTTLNYGVISPGGEVDVRLVYDHRVLDGSTIARALAQLESELHGEILNELRSEVSTLGQAA